MINMLLIAFQRAKDAARASKIPIYSTIFYDVDSILTNILELTAFKVEYYSIKKDAEKDILHLGCTHQHHVALCPRCKQLSDQVHDIKDRCIRDLDAFAKRVFIHLLARSFDCDTCQRPLTEQIAGVDLKRRQTLRFEQHIFERCLKTPKNKIAKEEYLDLR